MSKRVTKVLVCEDDTDLSRKIKSLLKKVDSIVVLGSAPKNIAYKPHPVSPMPIRVLSREHGQYRQFEKRDKRKNFR